jgi:glycosyltransferase involved in cell wall biosynthesis
MILTAMTPVTLSITVHGPDEFYDVTRYSLVQKFEAARFIVCISFFAQSQVMKFTPPAKWKNLDVVRLGVDCEEFQPRTTNPHQGFNVLCVGRLVAAKGQRILIEAVERLVLAGHLVRLVLVGDGPDRSSLTELVHHRNLNHLVTFAGSVNQDGIQEFYRQADVFAIASFAEGIPVVLMEAMAMEIPSVATRVMGIPELIEDGENGLLVPPSDVCGLAEALFRLMDDRSLAESLGRAGRVRVSEAYELGKSVDRLAAIFRQRLAGCI